MKRKKIITWPERKEKLFIFSTTLMVQFVTPSFHPNLISNMFSMPKFLHSYSLVTWFHQNRYPFKVNALNASQCTMVMFVSQ